MASKEFYISDKELEDLYNSLEKGSLVRMLIEKHRELEKQVKNLTIPVVSVSKGALVCENCTHFEVCNKQHRTVETFGYYKE